MLTSTNIKTAAKGITNRSFTSVAPMKYAPMAVISKVCRYLHFMGKGLLVFVKVKDFGHIDPVIKSYRALNVD